MAPEVSRFGVLRVTFLLALFYRLSLSYYSSRSVRSIPIPLIALIETLDSSQLHAISSLIPAFKITLNPRFATDSIFHKFLSPIDGTSSTFEIRISIRSYRRIVITSFIKKKLLDLSSSPRKSMPAKFLFERIFQLLAFSPHQIVPTRTSLDPKKFLPPPSSSQYSTTAFFTK